MGQGGDITEKGRDTGREWGGAGKGVLQGQEEESGGARNWVWQGQERGRAGNGVWQGRKEAWQ